MTTPLKRDVRVLYFSRGRGHGHAVPDVALSRELKQLDLRFVSYATGAETFRSFGMPVIDLELPEANPFLATLFAARRVIEAEKPAVVVAHEEFAALPAAHLAGIAAIFISDWLPAQENVRLEALSYASRIIMKADRGIFAVPPRLAGRTIHIGPIGRRFELAQGDRPRLRAELGIAPEAVVILVVPGGWQTEARVPIADLVFGAFDALERPDKHLLWVSAKDFEALSPRASGRSNVQVFRFTPAIERLMLVSDLLITKGNRYAVMDAAGLGVRSLSISSGVNRVDDTLAATIPTNVRLEGNTLSTAELARQIRQMLLDAKPEPVKWNGADKLSEALLSCIRPLLKI